MARRIETCTQCGKQFDIGDEYYIIKGKEHMFCSTECIKEFVRDNMFDDVFEEWADENTEAYDMESPNPYDRYGVSEGDF